jgi:hypothetical protein
MVRIVESTPSPTDVNIIDNDDGFSLIDILIISAIIAGGLLLIGILCSCFHRRMRAQEQQPNVPEEVLSFVAAAKAAKGKSRGNSVTVAHGGNDEVMNHTGLTKDQELLDNSRTLITIKDEYDDDDRYEYYAFDQEDGFHDEHDDDDDDATSWFPKQGIVLVGSYDDDDVESMEDEEQGIVGTATGQGTSNRQENPDYPQPATSSVSSFPIFCDDEDNHGVIGNPENNVSGDSEASDDGDYDSCDDRNKNETVGPLTWVQGDDDDTSSNDDSGNDTVTSLVSVGEMSERSRRDDIDSVAESIDRSYTSIDSKGSSLSSRQIAINTMIEQSKNGAEWFEFNDEDVDGASDDDDDDDDDDGSFTIENLGFDPADAAALRAIAGSRWKA